MDKYAKLGELGDIFIGLTYKPEDVSSTGTIVLRSSNIQDGELAFDDIVRVQCEVRENLFVKPNDILMCSRNGSAKLVGKCTLLPSSPEAMTFGAFMTVIRTPYNRYLRYFFDSPAFRNQLKGSATTTINQITRKMLDDIQVPIYDVKTQDCISAQFEKISKLIALRKEQLAKLDQLVKSRFVEMFGTEDEFERWDCCSIGEVADVCVGVVIKPTQYYTDNGIPAFRSLNIGEMRVKDSDWVYFTEEGHRKNQKSVVRKNDVLVVRSGAPGTACVATEEYDGYNAVDIIIAHPDNSRVNSIFLAAFTNMPHGMNQIRERTGGAAQQHFNVGGYKAMRLIMPPLGLQEQFAAFVEQTNKSKLTIQASLDKLELLKKSLMQQYFG